MADDFRVHQISIAVKPCQVLHTDQNMVFLGVPNTISARLVEEKTRLILDQLEKANSHNLVYKLDTPLKFAIISGFPPSIPNGEGIRLDRAFIFQVDVEDLRRLKALLRLANDKQAWKYIWGDYAQTIYAPTFASPGEERETYKNLVKLHEVFQTSMVAVKIDGLDKLDLQATVRVTPHAREKSKKEAVTLSVRDIFRRMKINGLPLWVCLSGSPEGAMLVTTRKGATALQTLCPALHNAQGRMCLNGCWTIVALRRVRPILSRRSLTWISSE